MYCCDNPYGVMKPWIPMKASEDNGRCTVSLWGRTYTQNRAVLFSSLLTQGHELLASPIRLVGMENGQEFRWEETESFIMSSSPEKVVLCGTQQSNAFVVNTACSTEYDGLASIELKIMPRGKTVGEIFGVSQYQAPSFHLDRLWVEIPLKKSAVTHFHYWPYDDPVRFSGDPLPQSMISMSRKLPSSMQMSFRSLLWLGTMQAGICWFAESDENWQPADPDCAIEILDEPETVTLRLHLLDSQPSAWSRQAAADNGCALLEAYTFLPLTFRFGLQATPVKPYPANPYQEKILHIDCFKKIAGEYVDFLHGPVAPGSFESGFDRMKRLGVTTLFLHEKWNKIQNFWELPADTARRIHCILDECHSRGIKVIPYFGYEISSLSPLWGEWGEEAMRKKPQGYQNGGGWYRKPNQRDYTVCYNSSWQDAMVEGVQRMLKEFPFDGIYLDSTLFPFPCANEAHHCGYTDGQGQRHVTYPILAIRRLTRRLYAIFDPDGRRVYTHVSNCCNIPSLAFCHLNWNGEHIQTYIHKNGADSIPMDYLQTEYTGRNFGVPSEFLAYAYPNWSFRDALSLSLAHGILPRPNDIGEPLEIISRIWAAFDRFPIESSVWRPYWEETAVVQIEPSQILGSAYEHICVDGKREWLLLLANPTSQELKKAALQFPQCRGTFLLCDALTGQRLKEPVINFSAYGTHVLYLREM